MFHIKVPATSANMGPGFDCVGVALELYNELWAEETDGGIDISSADGRDIPKGEKNLIYTTIKGFYDREGLKLPGVKIVQKDSIPMTRGLGSSAACIVGGLLAANAMSGRNYTVDRLALMAAELEGHPDNSNPALMGSMVVSAMHDGEMSRIKNKCARKSHLWRAYTELRPFYGGVKSCSPKGIHKGTGGVQFLKNWTAYRGYDDRKS